MRKLGAAVNREWECCWSVLLRLIVALLGVLKSGASYVPLDPDFPRERLRFMIEDADVRRCLLSTV